MISLHISYLWRYTVTLRPVDNFLEVYFRWSPAGRYLSPSSGQRDITTEKGPDRIEEKSCRSPETTVLLRDSLRSTDPGDHDGRSRLDDRRWSLTEGVSVRDMGSLFRGRNEWNGKGTSQIPSRRTIFTYPTPDNRTTIKVAGIVEWEGSRRWDR